MISLNYTLSTRGVSLKLRRALPDPFEPVSLYLRRKVRNLGRAATILNPTIGTVAFFVPTEELR
jgi:hypothetical protein